MTIGQIFCTQCGAEIQPGQRFCVQCGAATGADSVKEPSQQSKEAPLRENNASLESSAPAAGAVWDYNVPLLTNRFVLYDFVKVFGATYIVCVALMGGIFLATGETQSAAMMPIVFGIGVGFVLFLCALVMLVFFRNRMPHHFEVHEKGVLSVITSGRADKANKAGMIIGLLSGKPGLAGASMIAYSRKAVGCDWREIHKAAFYPREGAITLFNSWRAVIRLHCPPDEFSQIEPLVRQGLARGEALRAKQPPRGSIAPLLGKLIARLLFAFGAGVIACLLLLIPGEIAPPRTLGWIIGGAAVLAALRFPGRRLFAAITLLAVLALAGWTLFLAMQRETEPIWAKNLGIERSPEHIAATQGQYDYRRYVLVDDWSGAGVAAVALIALAGIGLTGLRPTDFEIAESASGAA